MSALTLTLKDAPRQRLDCSALTPTRLAGRTPAEIAAIELPCGNRRLRVDALFELTGEDVSNLVFRNGCDKLDRIGEGMFDGSIEVDGDAGAYLGLGLRGGRIRVRGNCGAFAAAEMKRGLVHIQGNAGDFLGAPLPGDRQGMRGGTVIVQGNAGDRCGDRLRRGNILVEGNAGDYCASRMIAGTLSVLGTLGTYPGFAMRRGTLLLNAVPASLPATFGDCGTHDLHFLPLLTQSWRSLESRFARLESRSRVRRLMGDLACDGKGEVLVWV
ncbi:MAG TPA: formylmethanofuran dehydrogenase subunit C [Burkholderiales bacterium]|nr:formylmethanofuran dehydrogenase subunit C [Burkholderiales bacterium]